MAHLTAERRNSRVVELKVRTLGPWLLCFSTQCLTLALWGAGALGEPEKPTAGRAGQCVLSNSPHSQAFDTLGFTPPPGSVKYSLISTV